MNNITPIRAKQTKQPRSRPLREFLEECTKPREAILGEWMREGHLCMVYAPTGVGKSFFALSCAIAVAGGGAAFEWHSARKRCVLLVDGEMDKEDIADRARVLIKAAPGVDANAVADGLHILAYQDQEANTSFPNIATPEGQDCIVAHAKAVGARLVILDNFSTLAQVEDENASASMDPLVELLRRLKRMGCAVIMVHHSKKGTGVGADGSYRGSSKMGVTFQSIIRLSAPEDHDMSQGVAFVFKFEKSRGLRTQEHEARRAHLTTSPAAWSIEADEDPTLTKLVRLVKSRRYSKQAELANALKVSTGALSGLKVELYRRELMSKEDWDRCLREAKDARQLDGGDADPFSDLGTSTGTF